jgi:4a-hydroxytetrahydrobiopterin dehydratase
MSTLASPTFSSNYNPEQGTKELSPLLKSRGGKWILIENGKGIERSFRFKTFKKTWVRHFLRFEPYYISASLDVNV